MASNVKIIDRGWNRLVKQYLKASRGVFSDVGIQGSEASEQHGEDGPSNVVVGSAHEFGAGVPERSFMRSTFDEKKRRYERELDKAAKDITDGASPEGEMLLLGEQYRSDVVNKIMKGQIKPPLQPSTIAQKKGETKPLFDTGQLVNSISVEVKKK